MWASLLYVVMVIRNIVDLVKIVINMRKNERLVKEKEENK